MRSKIVLVILLAVVVAAIFRTKTGRHLVLGEKLATGLDALAA